jgi:hypothetical protein
MFFIFTKIIATKIIGIITIDDALVKLPKEIKSHVLLGNECKDEMEICQELRINL